MLGNLSTFTADTSYNRITNINNKEIDAAYNYSKEAIKKCNEALDFLTTSKVSAIELSTKDDTLNLERIKGELYLIRAYAAYTLASINLPAYVPGSSNSDMSLPVRFSITKPEGVTTEEIYQQMVTDLKQAETLLPTEHSAIYSSIFEQRGKKFAAIALLAKVYFAMGDYNNSLTYLDKTIDNNGLYSLDTEPIDAFMGYGQSNEVIWYAVEPEYEGFKGGTLIGLYHYKGPQVTADDFNSSWTSIDAEYYDYKRKLSICSWRQTPMSYYSLKQIGWMTDPLNGDYSETEEAKNDKRYQQLYARLEGYKEIDPTNPFEKAVNPLEYELNYKTETTPNVWSTKYFRDGQITAIPVIRLPEIYLTRAIIRLKNGNIAGATADVNVIRKRAGLAELSTVTAQDIHNERIKELSTEGDRLNYIRALKDDATIGVQGADGSYGLPAGDRTGVSTLPYTASEFYWPLPIMQ